MLRSRCSPPSITCIALPEGLQTTNLEASTLEQALEAQFAELAAAVWVDRLRQAGVSAHAVVSVAELMEDPWGRSHGLSVTQTVEDMGEVASITASATFSRSASPDNVACWYSMTLQ